MATIKLDRNIDEFIKDNCAINGEDVFARLIIRHTHIPLSVSDINELKDVIQEFENKVENNYYCANCDYFGYSENFEEDHKFICKLDNKYIDKYCYCKCHSKLEE